MLNPKKDRLDYGSLLMPPEGYELTHALATSYSLDLHTLLAIPVALFYSKMMDGRFEDHSIDLLESNQQTASRLTIYCQKGKIKVPRTFNWLFAYVEDSIHEITPQNHRSSFHPKIWILRFKKAEAIRYRVIVLSRNLTFDRSWDLAFHVDGVVTNRTYPANTPLKDFVRYLFSHKKPVGANAITSELDRVRFEPVDGFKQMAFHPIGFDGYQTYTNPLDRRSFDTMLVVSPFLDKTTLKKMHRNCPGNKVLISREEEFQKIPKDVFQGYDPYFLSRRIVEGEAVEDMDETDFEPQQQQLHAKLFIGEQGHRNFWFLGSANCTDPAFTRNTEFMVGLAGANNQTGTESMKAALINTDDHIAIFEPYEPSDDAPDSQQDKNREILRRLEYDLIDTEFVGKLLSREKTQNFDLLVTVDTTHKYWDEDIRVTVAPLNNKQNPRSLEADMKNELRFENISEVELSVFVAVKLEFKGTQAASFLIKMQIDLPETRMDKILRNLIHSRENFLNYLNFLVPRCFVWVAG